MQIFVKEPDFNILKIPKRMTHSCFSTAQQHAVSCADVQTWGQSYHYYQMQAGPALPSYILIT